MSEQGSNPTPTRRLVEDLTSDVTHDLRIACDLSKGSNITLDELTEQQSVGFKTLP